VDYLTADRAREVFDAAGKDPGAKRRGALDGWDGFTFLAAGVMRVRVRPVAREDIPAPELAKLESVTVPDAGAPVE
jgi:hypothetical protein